MATGKDKTPPPVRSGEEITGLHPKEGGLIMDTPVQISTKHPRRETSEGTKRLRVLEDEAAAKQVELEDILLKMKEEKGKMKQSINLEEERAGTSSDESYDHLYNSPPHRSNSEGNDDSMRRQQMERRHLGLNLTTSSHPQQPTYGRREGPRMQHRQRLLKPHMRKVGAKGVSLNSDERDRQGESSSSEDPVPLKSKRPPVSKEEVWWRTEIAGPDLTTRGMARRALGKISASPFSEDICEAEPPKKFQMPRFSIYNGKSDPLAHYRHYMQAMTLWSNNEELLCRAFPSTLGDTALQWFHKLPPRSIVSWGQLAEEFVARFLANTKQPKTADILLTMKKKSNESLRDYSRRYLELYNEVEDCSEQLAVTSFKLGLKKEDKLWLSLTKKPAMNVSDLMCRIEKYAKVEDETKPAEQKDLRTSKLEGRRKGRGPLPPDDGRSVFEAVNTVFKEPIYRILPQIRSKPYFRRPGRLPDYPGKEDHKDFCAYHNDKGHRTGQCRSLRLHLEDLVKRGHLKEFIDGSKTRDADPQPRPQQEDQRRRREEPYDGSADEARPTARARTGREIQRPAVIHVIHMEARPQSVVDCPPSTLKVSGRADELMEVTASPSKRLCKDNAREISFSHDEGNGLEHPHNDALVVTLGIFESEVRRILVDAGSSTEVMFLNLFKKLGLTEDDLEPTNCPLVGFNSAPVWPLGRVVVPVRTGPVVHKVEFTVVDAPSSYNAIMGRSWIHKLKAVPSTYHQILKFPHNEEVVEIRGDQNISRRCLTAALKSQPCPEQVQLAEVPKDSPRIDDVGGDPQKKSVESLQKVFLGPIEDDRYFLIGSNLAAEERAELIKLLTQNIRAFAWTPEEMPGIAPDIMSHKLNVNPGAKPIVQKSRRSALQHSEAVVEEVDRLLGARAIREVSYPEWLANTVVVKKKTGKWRVCVDYTDLNKACPKDPFPLPKIDQLVDSTAGSSRMSFLDAYRGYHQIPMHAPDEEKTSFITPKGIFCYRVMPFGLKNAGATYQRLVTKIFKPDLGKTVEVYIDDMVVKSKEPETHIGHLQHVFSTLDKYGLKLNATKCAFGVSSGKFLGHLVTRRGIEADPDQISAIRSVAPPKTKKEVQKLTGMVAALNRFISRASDKCRPFFKLLKGVNRLVWDEEADQALKTLKEYLIAAPILTTPRPGDVLQLYLAVSEQAVSAVLLKEEDRKQKPIYYASKTLQGAEVRYLPMEKLTLALVVASKKLAHYFHAHTVQVITSQPIGQLLKKADITGRMAKWAVSLAVFDIQFVPRTAIKAQVMADFIAEFTPTNPDHTEEVWQMELNSEAQPMAESAVPPWQIEVDGSSSKKGSGVGVVLTTPEGVSIEYAIKLGFDATNNEAEYEALLAALNIARRLFAKNLMIKTDSQLVVNHLNGEYVARSEKMAKYLECSKKQLKGFGDVQIELVGRDNNTHADALATLAASSRIRLTDQVFLETLNEPKVSSSEEIICIQPRPSWIDPITSYLKDGVLPEDKIEARKLRIKAARFWLSPDFKLYKKSFTGPYLLCVHPDQVQSFLYELHEGVCGAHTGGRSLAHRAISQGYWWPKMGKDAQIYVRKCQKCQKFGPVPHQPARELSPLTSPWPFAQWGLDIMGPFPTASGNRKWLVVGTDYFTKWVEAEPLAHIKDADTIRFVWKNIITRYGVPRTLISDNGTQFDSHPFREYCSGYGIKNIYSSPAYPQSNGQAEASNKILLSGIKKKLEAAKGRWVDELPSVLWTYRTTPRRSTGESPFSLAYGMEAVIPLEVGVPTIRSQALEKGENDTAIGVSLDLSEERRELAALRLVNYQRETIRRYNKKVFPREFQVGDFVLRKLMGARKDPTEGKLSANWEGPFRVKEVLGNGAYRLTDSEGKLLKRPWNVAHLKLFYI